MWYILEAGLTGMIDSSRSLKWDALVWLSLTRTKRERWCSLITGPHLVIGGSSGLKIMLVMVLRALLVMSRSV